MNPFSHARGRTGAVAAVAAGMCIALAALPPLATAKSTPLTKKQVITLIKKYSKPGPRGADGKAGTAGTNGTPGTQFTTAANSGLTLSNGALSAVPGQGLSLSNNGLSVNLGTGMGLDPSNNAIQVNTGTGLNESASNLLQLNPSFGAWGTCPAAQAVTATSATGNGSFTCHYPTFANVLGGGLNSDTSSPVGTITLNDSNLVASGSETSLVSTTAPGTTGVQTTYYLAGDVQLDDTANTTQTVYCSLMQGTHVIQTGADTFGEGSAQVNIQGAYNTITGAAFSVQCQDQTPQTTMKASGTIAVLPLSQ